MNQSTKLNWILITFQVEIVALMPCIELSFNTLHLFENDVLFAWMIPQGMHFLLILLNKPNLPQSASIDHNSLACCFIPIFWHVWRHRNALFYESKVFSYRTLPKLESYSDSICCYLWFCSRTVKSCFQKKWWWCSRCTWYRVKFWWLKVRIGNAICILNFILIRLILFKSSTLFLHILLPLVYIPTWNKKKFVIRNFGQKYKLKVLYILSTSTQF